MKNDDRIDDDAKCGFGVCCVSVCVVFGVFFEATVMDRADGREGSSE